MAVAPVPPVRIEPGWYWYHFLLNGPEQEQWDKFHKDNAAVLKIRSSFGGDAAPNLAFGIPTPFKGPPPSMVVVFELKEPIAWTLNGLPSKAPKKMATTLADLSTSEKYQEDPSLADLVDSAKNAVGSASTALKVLLFGGAAILLFNLFRSTAPREEQQQV